MLLVPVDECQTLGLEEMLLLLLGGRQLTITAPPPWALPHSSAGGGFFMGRINFFRQRLYLTKHPHRTRDGGTARVTRGQQMDALTTCHMSARCKDVYASVSHFEETDGTLDQTNGRCFWILVKKLRRTERLSATIGVVLRLLGSFLLLLLRLHRRMGRACHLCSRCCLNACGGDLCIGRTDCTCKLPSGVPAPDRLNCARATFEVYSNTWRRWNRRGRGRGRRPTRWRRAILGLLLGLPLRLAGCTSRSGSGLFRTPSSIAY